MCIIGYYKAFQAQLDELLLSKELSSLFNTVISRWEVD